MCTTVINRHPHFQGILLGGKVVLGNDWKKHINEVLGVRACEILKIQYPIWVTITKNNMKTKKKNFHKVIVGFEKSPLAFWKKVCEKQGL